MAEQVGTKPRGRPKGAPPPEVRRLQLLDATRSLIKRQGPGASMDAIAAEAGVTKPVLYTHFGDKAGLSSALAAQVAEQLSRDVAAALDVTHPPQQQVRDAVTAFVRWVRDEPELFEFLLNSPTGGDTHADILRITNLVADEVAPALELLYHMLGRDDMPAALYAHGVVGFAYLAVEWWNESGLVEDQLLIDHLTAFIWAGLVGTGTEPALPPTAG